MHRGRGRLIKLSGDLAIGDEGCVLLHLLLHPLIRLGRPGLIALRRVRPQALDSRQLLLLPTFGEQVRDVRAARALACESVGYWPISHHLADLRLRDRLSFLQAALQLLEHAHLGVALLQLVDDLLHLLRDLRAALVHYHQVERIAHVLERGTRLLGAHGFVDLPLRLLLVLLLVIILRLLFLSQSLGVLRRRLHRGDHTREI